MKVCTPNYLITSVWYGLALIVNKKKWRNKIYKLGKVEDRIPVLQLIRSMSQKQKETDLWTEKDGFKPGSRIDSNIVETF